MKKIVVYILTIAIAITSVFALGMTTASAANDITFEVKLNTQTAANGDKITASIFITNNYADPITNVSVTLNGSALSPAVSMASLAGNTSNNGTQREITVSFPAGVKQLAYTFAATYTDPTGAAQTVTLPSKGITQATLIKVTGSASADKKSINAGDKVKFTFSFTNAGNVPITNATLKAPPIDGGDVIGQPFNLNPGDTKKMEYNTSVNKTIEVKPVLTYTADSTNKKLTLDTLNVTVKQVIQSNMTLTLEADKDTINPGDSVILTATIANAGNDKLSDIKLTDESGNPVTTKDTTLDAGESTTATVTVNPQATGDYTYTATATTSEDKQVNATSNPVTITVGTPSASPTGSEAPAQSLKIDVAADVYSLDAPGEVKFQVTVINDSDVLLNNVQVTEKTIGDIGTVSAMGKDSKTFEKKAEVNKTTDFVFTVTATNPNDGSTIKAVTDPPLTIEVKGGGSLFGGDAWITILIIIVIAIAVVGLVLFLLYRKNRGAGGPGPFGGSAAMGNGAYKTQRKPSSFNNTISKPNDRPRDAEPPKTARKPISSANTAPKPSDKRGNTKFGDRNKF